MAPPKQPYKKKIIFGSYCGTVLQYSIRGSEGGSVENNNKMQTFLV